MKRIIAFLVAIFMICTACPLALASEEPAEEEAPALDGAVSGRCGTNVNWTYSDGLLSITGSGNMADYTYSNHAPWYDYRFQITKVVIGYGVTSVGAYAFDGCPNISSVDLPASLKTIGEDSLSGIMALHYITIPYGVETIGKSAFMGSFLYAVIIPDSVTTLGSGAFSLCFKMEYAVLSRNIACIGAHAFSGCSALKNIVIPYGIEEIGFSAFFCCDALEVIDIPTTVSVINANAFYGCSALTRCNYGGTLSQFYSIYFYSGNSALLSASIHCADVTKAAATPVTVAAYMLRYGNALPQDYDIDEDGIVSAFDAAFFVQYAVGLRE